MPRLDNSVIETVWRFGDIDTHNWKDPGQNPPFDFCLGCWRRHVAHSFSELEIDHPPYKEQEPPCQCWECSADLTGEDDEGGDARS
jgi:hypothetical protein